MVRFWIHAWGCEPSSLGLASGNAKQLNTDWQTPAPYQSVKPFLPVLARSTPTTDKKQTAIPCGLPHTHAEGLRGGHHRQSILPGARTKTTKVPKASKCAPSAVWLPRTKKAVVVGLLRGRAPCDLSQCGQVRPLWGRPKRVIDSLSAAGLCKPACQHETRVSTVYVSTVYVLTCLLAVRPWKALGASTKANGCLGATRPQDPSWAFHGRFWGRHGVTFRFSVLGYPLFSANFLNEFNATLVATFRIENMRWLPWRPVRALDPRTARRRFIRSPRRREARSIAAP
jgi:hypothetical protein